MERGNGPTTYLSSQLRESALYLKDAGWQETATLVLAAADEIEQLNGRAWYGQTGRSGRVLPGG